MAGAALAEIDPDRWIMLQRMARTFYESKLIPEHFRKGVEDKEGIANCAVAMLLAHQMGENPLMVLQNVFFVGGRAGWVTQYVIARAKQSGVFRGPLRWRTEGEWPNLKVTCSADLREAPDDDCRVEISLDMQTARESGWTEYEEREGYGRDSRKTGKKLVHARWATPGMAEQMLRWRSASWLIRLYAPDCMFGLPTVDELEDTIKDVTPPKTGIDDFKPGALRDQLRASVAATEAEQVPTGGEVPHPHGDGEGDAGDRGATAAEGESPSPPPLEFVAEIDLVATLDARLREAAASGKRALNKAWLAMNPLERDLMRGARQSYEDMTA